ncbi:MAG: LLM class F420-dependent oxidoreductase [Chloroflexota bacterium]|jgi:probable F420-dependent oxidoreductase|nr:LLM class F420-dependent oxidoreductase [Chloroflexota bacterium]MQF67428.1 LLM class F420-dependent oxidoreductase [SAR202 cluster bacterium AD-802-F09_MRT_200m]|tara:strand:+ start:2671 stop:3522 length:852 start_codon:yes stop_codon:yes gene_type:complete
MSVGIIVPLPAYTLNPAFIAKKAEDLGFESIWYHEHPILPVTSASPFPATGGEIPWTYGHFSEPYISLAMAAAVTSKIKLATGITLVPERNPLILAKEISVLDLHSQGRFIFGVGAGWNREETAMMGGDFDHRWTQTREAVEALKELWTKDEAEYHGQYYDFPPVYCNPKPVQKPHPPVLLGGNAKNVLQRVARWGDGWLPNRATPDQIEESKKILEVLEAERGREPGSLTISVFGQSPDTTRQQVNDFLNAGALRVAAWAPHCETEAKMGEELERMAETMII